MPTNVNPWFTKLKPSASSLGIWVGGRPIHADDFLKWWINARIECKGNYLEISYWSCLDLILNTNHDNHQSRRLFELFEPRSDFVTRGLFGPGCFAVPAKPACMSHDVTSTLIIFHQPSEHLIRCKHRRSLARCLNDCETCINVSPAKRRQYVDVTWDAN